MGLVEGGGSATGLAGALQQVNSGGLSASAIQEAMSVSSPPPVCEYDDMVCHGLYSQAATFTDPISCAYTELT